MEETNHEYYVSLEVAKLLNEAGFDCAAKVLKEGNITYYQLVDISIDY